MPNNDRQLSLATTIYLSEEWREIIECRDRATFRELLSRQLQGAVI
jgi:hypothetical protein